MKDNSNQKGFVFGDSYKIDQDSHLNHRNLSSILTSYLLQQISCYDITNYELRIKITFEKIFGNVYEEKIYNHQLNIATISGLKLRWNIN